MTWGLTFNTNSKIERHYFGKYGIFNTARFLSVSVLIAYRLWIVIVNLNQQLEKSMWYGTQPLCNDLRLNFLTNSNIERHYFHPPSRQGMTLVLSLRMCIYLFGWAKGLSFTRQTKDKTKTIHEADKWMLETMMLRYLPWTITDRNTISIVYCMYYLFISAHKDPRSAPSPSNKSTIAWSYYLP